MDEILSFFTTESLISLALVPFGIFFLIKSITPNKKKEHIYTILTAIVLLIILALLIRYLKNII